MRACRADRESVRKTVSLGFSSHEIMVSVVCKHHILRFLWRFQLSHRCRCVSRMLLESACQSLPEPEPSKLLHFGFPLK